jgi:hypothetical protein
VDEGLSTVFNHDDYAPSAEPSAAAGNPALDAEALVRQLRPDLTQELSWAFTGSQAGSKPSTSKPPSSQPPGFLTAEEVAASGKRKAQRASQVCAPGSANGGEGYSET